MINNIKFGKLTDPKKTRWAFWVWDNLSGNTMLNSSWESERWIGIEFDIENTLSHETLHKILFKIEGIKASHGLDNWCKSRKWLYQDNSGIAFFAKDMGENLNET